MHRSTCFLIDDVLAIDAGALTSGLTLARQRKIRHILVSHCHLDHIKDLALLADNVADDIDHTIDIVGSPTTLGAIRRHVMNNVIWPDFTRIPSVRNPVYRYVPVVPGAGVKLGGYRVRAIPVTHPVDSTAFIVRDAKGAELGFSSDTGPTQRLWTELGHASGLRALLLEVSFPNRLQALADRVGHLTPRTMAGEIVKLAQPVPILLYHLKPNFEPLVRREVRRIRDRRLQLLRIGQTFRL